MAQGSVDSQALIRIWAARDQLKTLTSSDPTSDKLPSAREAIAEAVEQVLVLDPKRPPTRPHQCLRSRSTLDATPSQSPSPPHSNPVSLTHEASK